VTTTAYEEFPDGEVLESNARIPIRRWTHIAVVRTDRRIRLYVNGIIDAVAGTSGTSELNEGPLYIGSTPWHEEDCSMNYLIDNFKFFNRELTEIEVEAES